MKPPARRLPPWLATLGSLRLTVFLLGFSMVLVFFGTLDQVRYGVWHTQKLYFESFLAVWAYPHNWPAGEHLGWFRLPMPGGFTLGTLLLLNLLCAHFLHFRSTWRQTGIALTHAGIWLLLISGFATSFLQQESMMEIDEGQSSQFTVNNRRHELVLMDRSGQDTDRVVSIPEEKLIPGTTLDLPETPLRVRILSYHPNAALYLESQNPTLPPARATRGLGKERGIAVKPMAPTYKEDERNLAAAHIELWTPEEQSLGVWLVSEILDNSFGPQTFEYAGRPYALSLRFHREYLPFSLALKKFSHDRYPGTEIPRNFSSLVDIHDPAAHSPRQALIYMNHPLRYGGLTFYQAAFKNNDTTTVLQVVRNPGWLLPYVAVGLVFLGMTFQFCMHLIAFVRKRQPA